jgi:hypothetical protein
MNLENLIKKEIMDNLYFLYGTPEEVIDQVIAKT